MKARGRQSTKGKLGLVRTLTVRAAARLPDGMGPRGHVKAGHLNLDCALGRNGIRRRKHEGDAGTPTGRLPILYGFYRADRMPRPFCRVPLRVLPPDRGWCDDPASPLYNRLHKLPLAAGHEIMWRSDSLYDVVFVLDYNLRLRRRGKGSAIFLHCAKPYLEPTLGCVALDIAQLRRLLPQLARDACVVVK